MELFGCGIYTSNFSCSGYLNENNNNNNHDKRGTLVIIVHDNITIKSSGELGLNYMESNDNIPQRKRFAYCTVNSYLCNAA